MDGSVASTDLVLGIERLGGSYFTHAIQAYDGDICVEADPDIAFLFQPKYVRRRAGEKLRDAL